MVDELQPEPSGPNVITSRHEKVLIGIGATFCVRLIVNYAKLCENDLVAATIFLSVALGSTQHLRNLPISDTEFDGPFHKDELRRPVSISAIARSINLPIETVRRKCLRLQDLDMIEKTKRGHVIVSSRILARPEVEAIVTDGLAAMRVFVEQVRRRTLATGDELGLAVSRTRDVAGTVALP